MSDPRQVGEPHEIPDEAMDQVWREFRRHGLFEDGIRAIWPMILAAPVGTPAPGEVGREALVAAIREVTDYWPTPLGGEELAQIASGPLASLLSASPASETCWCRDPEQLDRWRQANYDAGYAEASETGEGDLRGELRDLLTKHHATNPSLDQWLAFLDPTDRPERNTVDDLAILDTIEEAKKEQRSMLPTGILDDKTQQFAVHNRNPGMPCNCLDCRAVREHFNKGVND